MWKEIREAIKKAIDDNAQTIQASYNYERSTFEGLPAAVIVPSDSQADYGSTANNKFIITFKIKIYNQIPKEGEQQEIEELMDNSIDEMITIFSNKDILNLPTGWVMPIPSAWVFEERDEGVYRVAEFMVRFISYQ